MVKREVEFASSRVFLDDLIDRAMEIQQSLQSGYYKKDGGELFIEDLTQLMSVESWLGKENAYKIYSNIESVQAVINQKVREIAARLKEDYKNRPAPVVEMRPVPDHVTSTDLASEILNELNLMARNIYE